MRTYFKKWLVIPALLAILFAPGQASAEYATYGFSSITGNTSSTITDQFSVKVISYDDSSASTYVPVALNSGQVIFLFENNVGIASSITDVYFQDGSLLGIANPYGSSGVSFDTPATPGEVTNNQIPNPDFVTTTSGFGVFSADSDSGQGGGVSGNGVNQAGEWLAIVFNLQNGQTYQDVINALDVGHNDPFDAWNADGSPTNDPSIGLRIALRVQSIGPTGYSDSFISTGPNPVPVPPGIVLMAIGSVGVFGFRRFRSRQTPKMA